MKIILTAINAKYIHSNPAVYSLRSFAKKYSAHVELAEYTINHRTDFILRELYKKKPDVLMFSCYIWNISCVCELIGEIHKLMPDLPIWVGGPEVSFECEKFLREYPMVTGIMRGEGEATFLELCEYYVNLGRRKRPEPDDMGQTNVQEPGGTGPKKELEQIRGIVFREDAHEIITTLDRVPLSMDEIPFCYEELDSFAHRIIYYESSRGCPFRCSYCLSSVEKSLRFRSLRLVERELQFFLDRQVPQVKFVDRTFNCNHAHAMAVWRYIKEHDNGVTNFHFEIAADLLTEEEIDFIGTMRPGLIQLEIGVQSTNPGTIKEIRRVMDLKRLEEVVRKVKKNGNIHQHLDLIAGLPFEDYRTFRKSFDRIYRLQPQQLQLGFLKVLKGSFLYENQKSYDILYHTVPPYEVMATRWISYDEILEIKNVEEMLEVYYNSGQFQMTMQILEQAFDSPFRMFWELGRFYEENGLFFLNHSRIRRCEILLDFLEKRDPEHLDLYQEALTFDLYYRENMKSRPGWAPEPALFKEEARRITEMLSGEKSKNVPRIAKNMHLEPFYYDFTGLLQGTQQGYPQRCETCSFYVFDYENRSPLTGQAAVLKIEGGES